MIYLIFVIVLIGHSFLYQSFDHIVRTMIFVIIVIWVIYIFYSLIF